MICLQILNYIIELPNNSVGGENMNVAVKIQHQPRGAFFQILDLVLEDQTQELVPEYIGSIIWSN